ncbi:MAG TPA: hypothetical protein VEX38_05605, partial [Fimbriimonadaceae bacterium]|nr:hypothetical protein [Fimbriimonadaceae bacterium]
GSAIGSLWAREKVNDLELQQRLETTWSISQGKKETNWDELITELALEFGIMTRFTSFVAVDRQVVNPGGKQDTIRVPVDMADGIEYEGIFGSAKPGRLAGGMPAPAVPAFRPGDPLLSVTAPASATVVAVFPDGDIKPLTWNPAVEKWEVRFDIPNSFREGVYHVKVHIRNVDGTRRSLTVPFEVTENTPELKPSSVLVGSSVRIEVPADPRWDRILLLTPNGEKLEFKYDAASGMFRVEGQFGPGWYQIVGADRAFGQRTIRILLGKEGRIEKIEPAH